MGSVFNAALILLLHGLFTFSVESSGKWKSSTRILKDISEISQYWANLRPYSDLPENAYGVMHTGLPRECQIEQVQVLHRHGARFPASTEYGPMEEFAEKVAQKSPDEKFTGPLAFLNTWSFQHGEDLILPSGVSMLHKSGSDFWNRYGRVLYKSGVGQPFYDPASGSKPLLRSNTAPRVLDSARAWAEGFFAQYNATDKYSLLIIPTGLSSNNTLSSFTVCKNFALSNSSISQAKFPPTYYSKFYLSRAKKRLNRYTPPSVKFDKQDIYVMQSMCAYDHAVFGSSDFCHLFTLSEWQGFEYTLDSFTYNTFSFGFPAGRAIGIGTLQEMISRLKGERIMVSHTSVNSTLSSDTLTFPLDQLFYADFTHEFVILATLTAMSMDYFRMPLPYSYPPPLKRTFQMSRIAPFGAHLITEKIGCSSETPIVRESTKTHYTSDQYDYTPETATYKFVRMRLNNGILPLKTIRGGLCDIEGRTDGLCPLDKFLESQEKAEILANYENICFSDYTYRPDFFRGDGNYPTSEFRANFTIGWFEGAPDGVTRSILSVNNQFPAPTITVNRGDIVHVTFKNEGHEPTSIHWHGIEQRGTMEMDGVPGINQCAIPPGESFTYTFSTKGHSGTYWYHSHHAIQYGDGLKGAFIIQDPSDPWKDFYQEEEILQCGDWYHTRLDQLVTSFTSVGGVEPPPDSGLINDIGQYNCSSTDSCSYYRATIRSGMTKRFRLINTAVYAAITISIDQHEMQVIEADGVYLDGNAIVRTLRMNPGQRYSVLVTAKTENFQPSYWIRSTIHPFPTFRPDDDVAGQPNISAILQYVTDEDPNPAVIKPDMDTFNNDADIIQASIDRGKIYSDEENLVPMDIPENWPPTEGVVRTFIFDSQHHGQSPGYFYFNNITFSYTGDDIALDAILKNELADLETEPVEFVEKDETVDFIINNFSFAPHPFHLHGHKAWVVAVGAINDGYLNATSKDSLPYNTRNPIYRDTYTVNPFSYIVIRFKADNPGIWVMHCHNDWHVQVGMILVFVEAQEQARSIMLKRNPPLVFPSKCSE